MTEEIIDSPEADPVEAQPQPDAVEPAPEPTPEEPQPDAAPTPGEKLHQASIDFIIAARLLGVDAVEYLQSKIEEIKD